MGNVEKCISETTTHILNVTKFINLLCSKILERGVNHDSSKLNSPELEYFTECNDKLSQVTYGSPEYQECLNDLKPALEHHYAVSRHHPEHFPNGIRGFNIVDLCELIADWKSSSMRQLNRNLLKSIEINAKRYNLSDDLVAILKNTADLLDK